MSVQSIFLNTHSMVHFHDQIKSQNEVGCSFFFEKSQLFFSTNVAKKNNYQFHILKSKKKTLEYFYIKQQPTWFMYTDINKFFFEDPNIFFMIIEPW